MAFKGEEARSATKFFLKPVIETVGVAAVLNVQYSVRDYGLPYSGKGECQCYCALVFELHVCGFDKSDKN